MLIKKYIWVCTYIKCKCSLSPPLWGHDCQQLGEHSTYCLLFVYMNPPCFLKMHFYATCYSLTSVFWTCDTLSTHRSTSLLTVASFQHVAAQHSFMDPLVIGIWGFSLCCEYFHHATWRSSLISVPCWDSLYHVFLEVELLSQSGDIQIFITLLT